MANDFFLGLQLVHFLKKYLFCVTYCAGYYGGRKD